jgi:hypothetical protein
MSKPEPPLAQVQRWMQTVIMHRGGVAEGVDSPEARNCVDITLADLETMIRPSRALSSADRLEIYVNAYYARLMECLDEEFAVTRYALGNELFGAVTFGYLQSHPSQSYTLGQLGANFPTYLAQSRLHALAAPGNVGPTWVEFVIELARFERLLYEVYDGPGTEHGEALRPEDLANIALPAWEELRLVVAPCLRLEPFDHPVHEYWAARKDGGEPCPPGPLPTRLAIYRRDFVVEHRELADVEFPLLSAIAAGSTLAQAIAAAIDSSTRGGAEFEGSLAEWFRHWAADGYFIGCETAERSGPTA